MSSGFGEFSVLAETECRDLLRTHSIGRIGWESTRGPQVLPVTYRTAGEDLVFLTSADSILAELRTGARVAVEVDTLDDVTRTGWSVMVRGTAAGVDADAAASLWSGDGPTPWVSAGRGILIRIRVDQVSGRVVVADD